MASDESDQNPGPRPISVGITRLPRFDFGPIAAESSRLVGYVGFHAK